MRDGWDSVIGIVVGIGLIVHRLYHLELTSGELLVRFWWLYTIVVLGVVLYVYVRTIQDTENRLDENQ